MDQVGGLTPFLDALRIPPTLRPGREQMEIALRSTWVRLHSEMAPTHVWTYEGYFPGPTIEVRRGQRIRVAWTNLIDGPYPAAAGVAPLVDGGLPASAVPGRGTDFTETKEVADLPAWIVTHLHGAVTGGGNDGWTENGVPRGDAQLSEYPNDQPATALWYHDHVLNVTRWTVFAGLAGMYLVRDEEEEALNLPSGKHEIPLVLADRNFELGGDGQPTGELLYKVPSLPFPDPESGESITIPFTGPYTLVNGVVWPHLEVEPRWYRFRLLNGASARTFDLVLLDETGQPVRGAIKQIGSDGGLLPRAVPVDFDAALPRLSVAPAERMDLLIDFRALRGKTLRLVNVGPNVAPGDADPVGNVPFPQVMEFRVGAKAVPDRFVLPGVVSSSFRRLAHDTPHGHRLVVLTPPGTTGGRGHQEMWEMAEVPEGSVEVPSNGVIQVTDGGGRTRTYRRIARTFDDALNFKIAHGAYEQWSFLNLGGPPHPMHIHLTTFQLMGRDAYQVTGFDPVLGGTREPIAFDPGVAIPLAPNERGGKDVVQVPAGQMVRVMGQFAGAHGRFMYHCHLLEHEDMGMMRPFVVMPREVLKFDHNPGHGGH
ncbi:multicopper oxidase domain-containing protein [Streptomyces sp. NBC_01803]|nr:multicopper oxidase domain-containing protein [Streptomyces sp. NBC_01803]WSA47584.1 multicopper oxidase domain-containing protein [Streptomyces sp. NBC_01803]